MTYIVQLNIAKYINSQDSIKTIIKNKSCPKKLVLNVSKTELEKQLDHEVKIKLNGKNFIRLIQSNI